MGSEGLKRLRERQLLLINLKAELIGNRFGDLLGGNRTKRPAALSRLNRNRNRSGLQLFRKLLRLLKPLRGQLLLIRLLKLSVV